jgi:DNA-binding NtrC family response regulator
VPRILFIDDDAEFSPLLSEALEAHGCQVRHVPGAEEALELLDQLPPPELDVVLLDQRMPRMSGLEFLGELHRRGVRLPVLLFTGWDAADVAIRASRLGAFRYLPKPCDLEPASLTPLLRELNAAVELAHLTPGNDARPAADDDILLGKSDVMRSVHWRIGEAAGHDQSVLLLGEVGTGKGQVAQAVHRYSARGDRPLLHVNCLVFADEASVDDRLFGCEPGRPGVFEEVCGGAVLLDHFHRLGIPSQARLAELIRDRVVYRNGRGAKRRPVQARVLACSSEDLPAALAEGRLYWELYSLLGATTIILPPLRERGDDVLLLAEHFLRQLAAPLGRPAPSLHNQARRRLLEHRWPGNVRELQGVLRRAVQSCRGAEIKVEDLGLDPPTPGELAEPGWKLPLSRERAYRAYLDAIRREPALAGVTDAEVFRWLKRDADGSEGLPASCETFQRYLREARASYDDRRNSPRAGRPLGRSVVRREEL